MPDFPEPDKSGHFRTFERGGGDFVPEMSAKCPRFSSGCHGFVRFCHHWKPGVKTLVPGLKKFSCYILTQFDAFLQGVPGRTPSLDS